MFLFMLVVAESSLLFSMLIVRLVSRWERKTFAHLRAELPPVRPPSRSQGGGGAIVTLVSVPGESLPLRLDEDGRLCYSPAVGVLVAGSRRTLAAWQKATALHEVDPDLLELAQALREVDAEALRLGASANISLQTDVEREIQNSNPRESGGSVVGGGSKHPDAAKPGEEA